MTQMIPGTDHSHYDWSLRDNKTGIYTYTPIDFSRSKSAFVILKACDGATSTPFFHEAYRAAREAGKLAAPYVWCYPASVVSPQLQAQRWRDDLLDIDAPIFVDFEETKPINPRSADLRAVIEAYRKLDPGRRMAVYTRDDYWRTYGDKDPYWRQFPLWLARYSSQQPAVPAPWTDWTFWQYSASGNPDEYGITNRKKAVDENYFYSDNVEELKIFFGQQNYIPPTEEPKMNKITIVWQAGANVRPAPSVNNVALRALPAGAVIQTNYSETTDNDGNRWIRISDKNEYVATFYGGALRARVESTNPPPSAALPVITVRLDADGYPPFEGTWTPL